LTGSERRQDMLNRMKESGRPIAGHELAAFYQVSRQVVVQDIALIRAAGHDVLSTNRGYILNVPRASSRIFKVSHTDKDMEDELLTIVDLGGTVVNVMVNHRVYGKLRADLGIDSRRKVNEFMEDMRSGKSSPLKNITSNYHYHLVEADNERVLDMIEEALKNKGFLVEE